MLSDSKLGLALEAGEERARSEMRVLFLCNSAHPMQEQFFNLMNERYSVKRFDPQRPAPEQFSGIDVVVDMGGACTTEELLDAGVANDVKLWQVTTTGLDHVKVESFIKKGMPLAHSPGELSAVPLAEHALYLMLCFAKGLKRNDASSWCRSLTDELAGKALGVIGFGETAR